MPIFCVSALLYIIYFMLLTLLRCFPSSFFTNYLVLFQHLYYHFNIYSTIIIVYIQVEISFNSSLDLFCDVSMSVNINVQNLVKAPSLHSNFLYQWMYGNHFLYEVLIKLPYYVLKKKNIEYFVSFLHTRR